MSEDVNRIDLRDARKADTEDRVIAAASDLFVAQGYAATALTQIATLAGVAPRTVYVRFGTKAALLSRAIDVALVGDTAPVSVADRAWYQQSLTLPTASERHVVFARGARLLFERAGRLLIVAAQAETTEPTIATAAQEARRATRQNHRTFWHAMQRDGLLPDGVDFEWLVDTSALLGSADTYVQITRLYDWNLDTYEAWLCTTWTRLSALASASG